MYLLVSAQKSQKSNRFYHAPKCRYYMVITSEIAMPGPLVIASQRSKVNNCHAYETLFVVLLS